MNYSIVLTDDDLTVTVMHIMYGGRDIDGQLEKLKTEYVTLLFHNPSPTRRGIVPSQSALLLGGMGR